MKKIAVYILLAILTAACHSPKEQIKDCTHFLLSDFGMPIELKGEIMPIDTLWKPTKIWCTDSLLITTDMYTDYFVQIYHKNGNKVAENIPRGTGPNERLGCWSLQIEDELIWSLDMQLSTMTAYKKDEFLTQSNTIPYKTLHFENGGITTLAVLPNNTFIGSDIADKKNLLSFYNSSAIQDTTKRSPFPQFRLENPSENLNKRMFEYRIFYNKKNDKLVLFYVYTDIIEIYNSKGELEKRIQGPDNFVPEMEERYVEGGVFVKTIANKTKFAYATGVLTSNEIWAFYYGISPEPGKELQNRLFVFDYNGTPLRVYNLEYPIFSFGVDEKEKVIYALSESPDPVIVKFMY